jgi:predicted O-methyltransferase YrrM
MIVNDRLTGYLHSLESADSEVVAAIEKEARADDVPIIRTETASLLKVLLRFQKPKRVLEIGTAVGYSAILMSECLEPGASIITVEKYEKRIPIARANIERANKTDCITLIEGDALEVMASLEPGFDFIFMDAAKGQYIHFLPEVIRLLNKGGLLVSDNVLQDGDIIESRFAVTRRNRTIHSRMREYLWQLKHMKEFETAVLTVGDGVTISTKLTD